jgi:hypothetical protein
MMVETEVAVLKDRDRAERRAQKMNERDAFPSQRYVVEGGIRPGTFSVVLLDGAAERPSNVHRAGLRDDLRERVSMRSLMRAESAKTAGHRLIG